MILQISSKWKFDLIFDIEKKLDHSHLGHKLGFSIQIAPRHTLPYGLGCIPTRFEHNTYLHNSRDSTCDSWPNCIFFGPFQKLF